MPADLTTYDAALKQTWTSNTIEEQLYNENPFLDRIEKTTRYKVGKQAVTPVHTGRNGGFTVLPGAGGNLNAAGNQASADAFWNYTHQMYQIQVQGSVIDGTSDNDIAVVNAIDFEVENAVKD